MGMTLPADWHAALSEELKAPYVADLKMHLAKEAHQTIFPPQKLVFSAFRETPFNDVRVVILGQDPYHGPGQAHGLCFSVMPGVRVPPSLKNIYKELEADVGLSPPDHGCLVGWARQGVLLLNATLTVRKGQPKSHYGIGWERFTDAVVRLVASRSEPVVFMLWGKSAQEKCQSALAGCEGRHAILSCAHPSPYSADRFFGCRHFSKANAYLKEWGKEPIDWGNLPTA